jgi:Sugar (and other) transporter
LELVSHFLRIPIETLLTQTLPTGGIDAVVPVYSSELSSDDARGTALAQEFQANILGLNMAFLINLFLTTHLSKSNQWAWRLPIIIMQIYPVMLLAVSARLPETPRWLVLHNHQDRAKKSLIKVFGEDGAQEQLDDLITAHKQEQKDGTVSYADMLLPSGPQFHPTVITVMGQINQALTGYGAVSVYGPQIFELLGFAVMTAEYLTMGNYLFYLLMMTFAWLLIDRLGRRSLMVHSAWLLTLSFLLLTVLGGLAINSPNLNLNAHSVGIPGVVILYLATSAFGIGWLVPPWLIPTEIYPSSARAQGAAISVVVWGFANFAVTLLTPIGFNHLRYWIFLVFAATNAFAGVWTWFYCPESGGRSFEENQDFFAKAAEKGRWAVRRVEGGEWLTMPAQNEKGDEGDEGGERQPLLAGLLGRDS